MEHKNILEKFTALKSEKEQYKPLWDSISKVTGITLDTNDIYSGNQANKSKQLDEFVDDPTSFIAVNQAGDYLAGILWGTGEGVLKLKPSSEVLDLIDKSAVEPFYNFASERVLYHINHHEAGFTTALKPYCYDQFAFGTSGIGAFLNNDFVNRKSDNVIVCRSYGVDNVYIDEGKSGLVDYVFTKYHWRVNRIIGEFCIKNGVINSKLIEKLPKIIRDAYEKNDLNTTFTVVHSIYPHDEFNPRLKGRKGAKYKGVWFIEEGTDKNPFLEEFYPEKPAAIARAIKIRNQIYGRCAGTMLLSTIRSGNFMVANTIEILEKMGNPSLGILNAALFGDSVLDTSPNGLTAFNASLMAGQNPVFPIHDIGDPTGIIKFLIPYLNEKVITAFKVDSLLDFASAKEQTATESLQRYAIRGKSLSGMLLQQKNELLIPFCKRAVSLVYNAGELGLDAFLYPDQATLLSKRRPEKIIPDAVLSVIKSGRCWYELEFNNELEKLVRTEKVQAIIQIIQSITAIAALYPEIILAIQWYKLLKDINDNLDANNQIMLTEKQFKDLIEKRAQQQQAAIQMQAGQSASITEKNLAQAQATKSK